MSKIIDQLTLPLGKAFQIDLPPLEAADIKHNVWLIRHRILPGANKQILSSCPESVSGREIGNLITTNTQERLLLTRRSSGNDLLKSKGIGILKINADGLPTEWLSHQSQSDYKLDFQQGESTRRNKAAASWRKAISFTEESHEEQGLRRPQVGALHSIGAHWSVSKQAALIMMPTGTGKTETMLAAMVAFSCQCILVVTPSAAVRDQVAEKFRTLGKLREFGLIRNDALNPVVGVIKRRPRSSDDLSVFRQCNVIVSTVTAIAQGTAEALIPEIASLCTHLFIDEAHHVAARTWKNLKSAFDAKPVLLFTATPFREDGEKVDGKLIYSYPLASAQTEGYFKHINFTGIFEPDQQKEDEAIAEKAIAALRADLANGLNHVLMARCANKIRAKRLYDIYVKLAPELQPVEIHSDIQKAKAQTERLVRQDSRIVICVNMLAEGFDLPNLKIAAVHDKHKSLAVLLQFIGRFTRTASAQACIGNATVVANTADPDVADALQGLYTEDADWDRLLAKVSLDRMQREQKIIDFLRTARPFEHSLPIISLGTIRPKQSAVIYESKVFEPEKFVESIGDGDSLQAAWILDDPPMLVSVYIARDRVRWTRNRRIEDCVWELRIAYFDKQQKLIFIHGTDQGALYSELAEAISKGTARRLQNNDCFRIFGDINRLTLHQVGVKKQGARKAVSYTQHSGSDVKQGLSETETSRSRKAMISGTGFEKGARVAVGGSRKGKVWARHSGPLLDFAEWCNEAALKIRNSNIDPEEVMRDGLKAELLSNTPDVPPLRIEWGERLQGQNSGNAEISLMSREWNLFECDIILKDRTTERDFVFAVVTVDGYEFCWVYKVSGGEFHIIPQADEVPQIERGRRTIPLTDFFQDDPPSILFIDGSEMMGAEIYRPKPFGGEFPPEQLIPHNWLGVDLTKESLWKNNVQRPDSVQARAIEICKKDGFDFIFNDDDAGEIADLVCLKQTGSSFTIRLVHCKYSGNHKPGLRVGDVYEVAAQSSRSVRWTGKFHELAKQLKKRSHLLQGKSTRLVLGGFNDLKRYERLAAVERPSFEIVAVQPGITKSFIAVEQRTVLAAADAYLRQTVEIPLMVWCSA